MTILFDIIAVASLGLSIFNSVRGSKASVSAPVAEVAAPVQADSNHNWSGHSREVNHKLFVRGRR